MVQYLIKIFDNVEYPKVMIEENSLSFFKIHKTFKKFLERGQNSLLLCIPTLFHIPLYPLSFWSILISAGLMTASWLEFEQPVEIMSMNNIVVFSLLVNIWGMAMTLFVAIAFI